MSARRDRVQESTSPSVQHQLDQERLESVTEHVGASAQRLSARLRELDREWDVERVLETNAASLALLGVLLSATRSRRWLLLPAVVTVFLLQHAIQGWCPPLALLRRLGVRTRREIDTERTALKALRGDFAQVGAGTGTSTGTHSGDHAGAARRALAAAQT